MLKKIKNFFTTNLYWKALSVLLAIGLWFVVMNINNPTEIKTFTLSINVLNEEKLTQNQLVVLNLNDIKNQKAEIKIKGTRTTLDEISKKYNKENIKISLDLEQLLSYNVGDEPLETTVSLKPNMPMIQYPNNNFEIVSFYPLTTTLYLDKLVTIPKKIHPKTVGEVKSGYVSSEPELSSEYIQVTGAKSIVEKIQVIYAEVDLTEQTQTITKNVKPVAYDKEGNKITDISFNLNEVSIKVPINVEGVVNITKPQTVGDLPKGYIIEDILYEPKTVEVIGNTHNLIKLDLPQIDVSNLTETTQYTYDISQMLEQYNLKLKNDSQSKIIVNIIIKPAITKQINVSTSKISVLGYNDEFFIDMPEYFTINITGDENLINNINENEIKYSADITNFSEGTYKTQVDVILPEGVTLVSKPYIEIKISKKNKEETIQQPIQQYSETTIEQNNLEPTTEIQTETTT